MNPNEPRAALMVEMPLYELECPECGAVFEEIVRSTSPEALDEVECPDCGRPHPERLLSVTARAPSAGGSLSSWSSGGGCGSRGGRFS